MRYHINRTNFDETLKIVSHDHNYPVYGELVQTMHIVVAHNWRYKYNRRYNPLRVSDTQPVHSILYYMANMHTNTVKWAKRRGLPLTYNNNYQRLINSFSASNTFTTKMHTIEGDKKYVLQIFDVLRTKYLNYSRMGTVPVSITSMDVPLYSYELTPPNKLIISSALYYHLMVNSYLRRLRGLDYNPVNSDFLDVIDNLVNENYYELQDMLWYRPTQPQILSLLDETLPINYSMFNGYEHLKV